MNEARIIFKSVRVENKTFLYPFPIIKEKKYLIEIDEKFADFYIHALEHGKLLSFDENPLWMIEKTIHSDGNTIIYELNLESIEFTLLSHPEKDPTKAETINILLNKKMRACLNGEDNAFQALLKTYQNQLSCSTCQSLGIEDPALKQLIDMLEF